MSKLHSKVHKNQVKKGHGLSRKKRKLAKLGLEIEVTKPCPLTVDCL